MRIIDIDHTIIGEQHPDDRVSTITQEQRINLHRARRSTRRGAEYVPIYAILKNAQHLHCIDKAFLEAVFSWGLQERYVPILVKDEDGDERKEIIAMRSDVEWFYKEARAAGDLEWIKAIAERVGFDLPAEGSCG